LPSNESKTVDFPSSCRLVVSELERTIAAVEPGDVEKAISALLAARRVFVVGVGRVSLVLQAFVKRLNHLGIDAWVVGAVNEPALEPDDLLVVGSGSGESIVPVAIARRARQLGGTILYVGSNLSSTVAVLADHTLRIPCRTKLALPDEIPTKQPMASLFEQALLLVCDAICLMIARRGGYELSSYGRHANLE